MSAKTIILFYEKNHLKNPFIKLLIDGLEKTHPEGRVLVASFAAKKAVPADLADRFVEINLGRSGIKDKIAFKRAYGARKPSLKLLSNAQRIFEKYKPDVIVSFFPGGLAASLLWARKTKCRTVYYPFELYGHQRSEYSKAVVLMEKFCFRAGPDAVVTQNEQRAAFYVGKRGCRSKPFIAHNYKSKPDSNGVSVDLYERHGIPKEKRMVLYQGMLSEGRWMDRLVEAARYLADDAILVLMGPRQPRWWDKYMEPLVKDISLLGKLAVLDQVEHEKVFSYTSSASVGVVIYDDSVLNNLYCEPGKLGDFVHAGVPVIAPGFPSIKPVVEQGKLGITYDDFSSKGIADAINALLALPQGHFSESLRRASEYMTWEAQWPALSDWILGHD